MSAEPGVTLECCWVCPIHLKKKNENLDPPEPVQVPRKEGTSPVLTEVLPRGNPVCALCLGAVETAGTAAENAHSTSFFPSLGLCQAAMNQAAGTPHSTWVGLHPSSRPSPSTTRCPRPSGIPCH